MFSPSKRIALVLAIAIASTLALPLLVHAGTVVGDAPPAPAATPAEPGYQVRCWQYGRLLFEERDVQIASDTVAGLKLRGSDRHHQAVYLTDTGNATCLIRGSKPARR